jgi:hypothetical protein
MRNLMRILAVSLALAAAVPASAQYTFTQPGQQPQPIQALQVWNNVARVNLGVGFYNSGWANCYYAYWTYYPVCTAGSYASYIPFIVGPQVDFNLSGTNNISVGFTVGFGSITQSVYNQGGIYQYDQKLSVTLWEPTVDYVAKFGPPTMDTVGRFRIGGGMYIGPNSTIGGAFRIGGGASLLNANRVGVGVDLVLEGGSFNGYWIGGLQLLISPEFHF